MKAESGLFFDSAETALYLRGEWSRRYAAVLEQEIAQHHAHNPEVLRVDLGAITRLDTAGGVLLMQFLATLNCRTPSLIVDPPPAEIAAFLHTITRSDTSAPIARSASFSVVEFFLAVGAQIEELWQRFVDALAFIGSILISLMNILLSLRRFPVTSLIYHCDHAGIRAVPVIAMLTFMTGTILTQQGAVSLRPFGAESFVVDLVAITILREIGVLLACILVAGRSGSAFAAAIATMKAREEVDAMRVIGLDIAGRLVIPRILALLIMMPLLVFLADIFGLLGCAIAAWLLLDLSFLQFLVQLQSNTTLITHFWIGLVKTPFMAFAIAFIGCFEGFQATGSSESIGRSTTRAVVETIFAIILIDGIFAVIFSTFEI